MLHNYAPSYAAQESFCAKFCRAYLPGLMKSGMTLADRMLLLEQHCGSQRAVGRLLGISDMTIKNWKGDGRALDSKLLKAARKSGLSFEWLRDGIGSTKAELAKIDAALAAFPAIAEDGDDWLLKAIQLIQREGDAFDRKSLADAIEVILTRIERRRKPAASARYAGGSE